MSVPYIPREGGIRMGTTAIHWLGDISREKPSYFIYDDEDNENYYGSWVEGYGFINVRFPKASTRDLTREEEIFAETHGVMIV